ncbi:MAG TPA: hypothetical protein VEZ16_12655 [Microvirga sp.]|nr:hypothetical protein [Microvirga sp.]
MIYTQEVLNRTTGDLEIISIGDWLPITELAQRYRVGPRQFRAILHHMGILQPEAGRYRLPKWAVERGLGKRHERPKSGKPFDVISPRGQDLIAQAWEHTREDYELSLRQDIGIEEKAKALAEFARHRRRPMKTQEEVCWLLDHFRDICHEHIAKIIEIDRALVVRYARRRENDRAYWQRWKDGTIRLTKGRQNLEARAEYMEASDPFVTVDV